MKGRKAVVHTLQHEYKHTVYEPLMLQFNMLMQASDKSYTQVATLTGITSQTLRNWHNRKTRRPNSSTLRMAYKALGYTLRAVKEGQNS